MLTEEQREAWFAKVEAWGRRVLGIPEDSDRHLIITTGSGRGIHVTLTGDDWSAEERRAFLERLAEWCGFLRGQQDEPASPGPREGRPG